MQVATLLVVVWLMAVLATLDTAVALSATKVQVQMLVGAVLVRPVRALTNLATALVLDRLMNLVVSWRIWVLVIPVGEKP